MNLCCFFNRAHQSTAVLLAAALLATTCDVAYAALPNAPLASARLNAEKWMLQEQALVEPIALERLPKLTAVSILRHKMVGILRKVTTTIMVPSPRSGHGVSAHRRISQRGALGQPAQDVARVLYVVGDSMRQYQSADVLKSMNVQFDVVEQGDFHQALAANYHNIFVIDDAPKEKIGRVGADYLVDLLKAKGVPAASIIALTDRPSKVGSFVIQDVPKAVSEEYFADRLTRAVTASRESLPVLNVIEFITRKPFATQQRLLAQFDRQSGGLPRRWRYCSS